MLTTKAKSSLNESNMFDLKNNTRLCSSARVRQATDEFQQRYAKRAGVEGTISQGTRSFGLRRCRYIGLAETHLQHVATACTMNQSRLMAWFQQVPKARTRISPFAALGVKA